MVSCSRFLKDHNFQWRVAGRAELLMVQWVTLLHCMCDLNFNLSRDHWSLWSLRNTKHDIIQKPKFFFHSVHEDEVELQNQGYRGLWERVLGGWSYPITWFLKKSHCLFRISFYLTRSEIFMKCSIEIWRLTVFKKVFLLSSNSGHYFITSAWKSNGTGN